MQERMEYIAVRHEPEIGADTLNQTHAADTQEKVAQMSRHDRRALAKKVQPSRGAAKRAARRELEFTRSVQKSVRNSMGEG